LSVADGRLVQAAVIELDALRPARIVLVIHRLVIDDRSWRILLEDLWSAYEQLANDEEIQLPPKTMSFPLWADHLASAARSGVWEQEAQYWLALVQTKINRLPADLPDGAGGEPSVGTIATTLGIDETRALLESASAAYHAGVDEVLLTALVQVIAEWTGNGTTLIEVEACARDVNLEDADLSRTVGWFVNIFPARLNSGHASNPGDALISIKEQLRRIPNQGKGYGVLRYLSANPELRDAMREIPSPEIAFKYSGRFDAGRFRVLRWQRRTAATRTGRDLRASLVEVDGSIVNGCLELTWSYGENVYRRSTIERLAVGFAEALRSLMAHCNTPEAGGITPSDFSNARLSQSDLDKLIAKLH